MLTMFQLAFPLLALLTAQTTVALKYLSGDFLADSTQKSPTGLEYPKFLVDETALRLGVASSIRSARSAFGSDLYSPDDVRRALLSAHAQNRRGRNFPLPPTTTETPTGCSSSGFQPPLCDTKFNTTAPMFGVSLTSGKEVSIVQKFPDLLQQVIYEVCETSECQLLRGECVQTFVPYLFLVIPLGPVTLTGQDYVLVESGCECKPAMPQYGKGDQKQSGSEL